MNKLTDEQFFAQFHDRQTRVRLPAKVMATTRQRGVEVTDECESEFRSLGMHQRGRRRILLWRVPVDNPYYNPDKPAILKIPFLAFADESIEDDDATLLPIIHRIMLDARNAK